MAVAASVLMLLVVMLIGMWTSVVAVLVVKLVLLLVMRWLSKPHRLVFILSILRLLIVSRRIILLDILILLLLTRCTLPFSAHLFYEVIYMSWVISLFFKNIRTSSDPFHEDLSLPPLTYFDALLNHVVTILVFHHLVKNSVLIHRSFILSILIKKLFDELNSVAFTCILQTFLYHITCKLMVTQFNNFTFNTFYYSVFIFLTSSMLKYMLNYIVTKLIHCQSMNFCQNLVNNGSSKIFITVL